LSSQVHFGINIKDLYPARGISLLIAKKIVERHGGRNEVESEIGKGATFSFTVQINQSSPES